MNSGAVLFQSLGDFKYLHLFVDVCKSLRKTPAADSGRAPSLGVKSHAFSGKILTPKLPLIFFTHVCMVKT